MKAELAGNLVAAFAKQGEHYQPVIDDGEALFVFDAYNYSGKEGALAHAQKTIDSLQTTIDNVVASWPIKPKARAK